MCGQVLRRKRLKYVGVFIEFSPTIYTFENVCKGVKCSGYAYSRRIREIGNFLIFPELYFFMKTMGVSGRKCWELFIGDDSQKNFIATYHKYYEIRAFFLKSYL